MDVAMLLGTRNRGADSEPERNRGWNNSKHHLIIPIFLEKNVVLWGFLRGRQNVIVREARRWLQQIGGDHPGLSDMLGNSLSSRGL